MSEIDVTKELETLREVIVSTTGISRELLISKTKKREVSELKMMCSYIMKKHIPKTTVESIGQAMGINHSTVSYHMNKHEELMIQKNGSYKKLYDQILEKYFANEKKGILLNYKSLLDKKKSLEKQISQHTSKLKEFEFELAEVLNALAKIESKPLPVS